MVPQQAAAAGRREYSGDRPCSHWGSTGYSTAADSGTWTRGLTSRKKYSPLGSTMNSTVPALRYLRARVGFGFCRLTSDRFRIRSCLCVVLRPRQPGPRICACHLRDSLLLCTYADCREALPTGLAHAVFDRSEGDTLPIKEPSHPTCLAIFTASACSASRTFGSSPNAGASSITCAQVRTSYQSLTAYSGHLRPSDRSFVCGLQGQQHTSVADLELAALELQRMLLTFWCRRCTLQSRSCRCTTLPCVSARIWTCNLSRV